MTLPCRWSTIVNVSMSLTERSRIRDAVFMATEPHAVTFEWDDRDGEPWLVTVWWRRQHGTAVPVGLKIIGWDPDDQGGAKGELDLPAADADVPFRTVGSQFFKALPVGQIIRESRAILADLADPTTAVQFGVAEEDREAFQEWSAALEDQLSIRTAERGGRDLGDAHYAEVARIYRDAAASGQPPRMAVASRFTITPSAAAKQISRARERGFLPPTSRGRVGKLQEEL